MSYYQTGLSFRLPSPLGRLWADQRRGASMIWEGLSRGDDSRSVYQRGSGRPRVRAAGSETTTDQIIGWFVNLTHILLVVGGMWLLITAILNH